MSVSPTPPPAVRPPVKPKAVIPDCKIEAMPSGEGICRIIIPADVMRRLRSRANVRTIEDFVWTDVIRPALYGSTF